MQLATGPGEDAGACLHLAIAILVEELEERCRERADLAKLEVAWPPLN
jgi:hypothetical protein